MRKKLFKDIVLNYKTVFFDAFGVLKNHKGIIPGIKETLSFLEDNDINFYVLTNDASRSPEEMANFYQFYGIKCITSDKIISSGMLAKEYLKHKIKKGTVTYLGTNRSAHYINSAGLETIPINQVSLDELDQIKCMVFLDDEGFDWNTNINKVINLLRKKNMSIVVANTDKNYPVNKNDIAVAIGGIADMVEMIVKKNFIRFGKPDAQMFLFAYEKAISVKPVNREEILMVGDTLFTDIIGGNKFGLDTALVLSGNTLPEMVDIRIRSSGIIPNYVCDSILIS